MLDPGPVNNRPGLCFVIVRVIVRVRVRVIVRVIVSYFSS